MTKSEVLLAGLLRTYVPILVGLFGPILTNWIGLTDVQVNGVVVAVVTAVYYGVVHALEVYVWPKISVLLGYIKQPVAYSPHPVDRTSLGR
jgi:MFS-type transporter involved in bile tolerance (Atg22 family)